MRWKPVALLDAFRRRWEPLPTAAKLAIVAGAVVLSEPVTAATGVGFVLVLLGSALVTRRPKALVAELLPPEAAPIAGATILGPSTAVRDDRAEEQRDAGTLDVGSEAPGGPVPVQRRASCGAATEVG